MSYTDKTLKWGHARSAMTLFFITVASLVFFGGIGLTFANTTYGITSPKGMRWFQFSVSLGLFLMPPLIFSQIATSNPARFLQLVYLPSYGSPTHSRKNAEKLPSAFQTYTALAMVCIGAFFAIDLLAQLNQYIVPNNSYFQGLKDQEALVIDSLKTLLKDTSSLALLANAVVLVLVPAFGEEFFFRGVLQKMFNRSIGIRGAILASAACFAVAHQQPLSFIPLLFMGVLLGYTKYWTGSLWAPIILHSINNGFALLSSYSAGGELQTESTIALGWSMLGLVPLILGIVWLRSIRIKHSTWLDQ
tara:strand:+ start:5723 stop:6634 length:912 start_codon:yes stop_codon:yes gene_type:complete